jgi:hypothetical protein
MIPESPINTSLLSFENVRIPVYFRTIALSRAQKTKNSLNITRIFKGVNPLLKYLIHFARNDLNSRNNLPIFRDTVEQNVHETVPNQPEES